MATSIQDGINRLRKASSELRKIISGPIPRDLSQQESQTADDFFNWVGEAANEMDAMADLWEKTKEMAEMNQQFNQEYLQLQQKMQADNRQFTMVSNIMKTKHDTAKTAINNVR